MVPGFHISTNIHDMDLDAVYSFISSSYWSEKIPRDTFNRAVENSLCFAILDKQNLQLGFARAVTDRAPLHISPIFMCWRTTVAEA